MKQIYLQRESAGTLVLESAYLTPKTTQIDNLLNSKMYLSNNTLFLHANGNVKLFDMSGRLLLQRTNVCTVDLSSFKSGVYVVKAAVEGKQLMTKIVK